MYDYNRFSTSNLRYILGRKELKIARLKQIRWQSPSQLDELEHLRRQCVAITTVIVGRTCTLPLWDDWKDFR